MRRRLALLAALAPGRALAHASERMIILTLPTGRYILGAATVVALTALLGALAPRLPAFRSRRLASFPAPPANLGSWIGFATLAALLAIGFLGPHDPLGNLLTLTVWTLALGRPRAGLHAPRRPLARHRALDRPRSPSPAASSAAPAPSASPASATGRRSPASSPSPGSRSSRSPPTTPPSSPAPSPSTGSSIFALAVLEGPAWLRQGEALTVFFRFLAKIAPALVDPRRRPPRASTPARPARSILATAAARPLRRRLRHPRPRHRQLRRPAPHLLVAHPSRHQPARVPRPLRRHPPQHPRPPRSPGR